MRKQWLAAAGLLLALALAIAGELLFDSTSSLALSIKPAGGLALAASLTAAILAAWLAPARSDAPGLSRPLPPSPSLIRPPDLPQAPVTTPPSAQTLPWARSTLDQGDVSRLAWLRPAGIGLAIAFVAVAQFLFADKLSAPVDPWTASGSWLAGDLGGDGALWHIGCSPRSGAVDLRPPDAWALAGGPGLDQSLVVGLVGDRSGRLRLCHGSF